MGEAGRGRTEVFGPPWEVVMVVVDDLVFEEVFATWIDLEAYRKIQPA